MEDRYNNLPGSNKGTWGYDRDDIASGLDARFTKSELDFMVMGVTGSAFLDLANLPVEDVRLKKAMIQGEQAVGKSLGTADRSSRLNPW